MQHQYKHLRCFEKNSQTRMDRAARTVTRLRGFACGVEQPVTDALCAQQLQRFRSLDKLTTFVSTGRLVAVDSGAARSACKQGEALRRP
jgi:hypothetical protein